MSDEYPGEEPGTAAPTWAAVPTMPWSRVPEQRRDESERRAEQGRPEQPWPEQGRPEQAADGEWQSEQAGRRPQGRTYGTPAGGRAEHSGDEHRLPYRGTPQHPQAHHDPQAYQGQQHPGPQHSGPQHSGQPQSSRPGYGGQPNYVEDPTEHGFPVQQGGRPPNGYPDGRHPARPDERHATRPDERHPARTGEQGQLGFPLQRGPAGQPGQAGSDARRPGPPGRTGYDVPSADSRPAYGGQPPVDNRQGYNGQPPSDTRQGYRGQPPTYGPAPGDGRPGYDARPTGYGQPSGGAAAGGGQQVYGRPAHGPGGVYGLTPPSRALDAVTDEVPRYRREAPRDVPQDAPMSAPPLGNVPLGNVPMSAPPAGEVAPGNPPLATTPLGTAPLGTDQRTEPTGGAPASTAPAGAGPSLGAYRSAPLTGAGVDGLQATGYLPIVRPGAEGFPPELAALMPTSPAPRADAEPKSAGPDPEQVLAGYVWRFDPDTLREQIEGEEVDELQEIRDLLTTKLNGVADNPTRARLLSLRAVVSRILGDLLKAFADGKLALAHAEATGELRRVAIAQARLAHVLQWREEFDEADRLFTLANSSELPDRLRATMHQHAGKCAYDQGRYMEACNHFERALDLRKEEDPELIAQTELALDAVFRRVAEKGWGPYPRTRDEILQIRKPPAPAFDEQTQRWGYVDLEGNFNIGPGYIDVQPFRDGVAWVQRQGAEMWELIDDTGRLLIEPAAGYLGVSSFSDGVAWVSRDGSNRWIAIDKTNAVLISTGYDDVRPFRRGVAAVRRGPHWGAVDGVGRVVVSFQYDGFATALLDGRYIDGFSDEGLAVVSLDGRKGVVDRSGRVIVPTIHHTLMIHPVAFLVADDAQRWGALDRRGRTVIDLTFPSRVGVTDEIDRLLADTRPVM